MLTTNFINTLTYTNRYWSTIQNGTLNLCSHFILGSLWHSSNQLIKLIENWFCAVMHARILYVWQSPNFFLHPRDKLQWAGEVPHSLCREQHIPSGHLPSSGPQLITLSPAMENLKVFIMNATCGFYKILIPASTEWKVKVATNKKMTSVVSFILVRVEGFCSTEQ